MKLDSMSRGNTTALDEGYVPAQCQYKLSLPRKLNIKMDDVLADHPGQPAFMPVGVWHGLSIADVRPRDLQNNLSMKVVQSDPQIAKSALGRSGPSSITLSMPACSAGARTGRSPAATSCSSMPKMLSWMGSWSSWTRPSKKIDYLDGEAGIAIPLRTGGLVRASTPFERKLTEDSLPTDEYRRVAS